MRAFSVISCGFYILFSAVIVNSGTVFKTIITPGTGPQIQPNQTAVVHYSGTLESGVQFDSSRDRGEPFEFTIGKGEVIPGWDAGVATMKVGERAQLEIAPEDAYGSEGIPGAIPPNAKLIFDIELLSIKGHQPDASPGPPGGISLGVPGDISQDLTGFQQGQTDSRMPQQGVSFSNILQPEAPSSFQMGTSEQSMGQQSMSGSGMGFPGASSGSQQETMSQFLPGFDFSGSQGSSSTSGRAVMPGASQPSSPDIVDMATRGQGFNFGTQDLSSQIRDLTAQPQGFQPQPESQTQMSFQRGSTSQQSAFGFGNGGSGQSFQTSVPQPGTDTRITQFQGLPGFVSSSNGQSSFGQQNTFQSVPSPGRDSSMGSRIGFGQTPGLGSVQSGLTVRPQPSMQGFSRNGINPNGGNSFFGGQTPTGGVSSSQQFQTPNTFSGTGSRPDRPIRMNTDQPSTQMQPLGGSSFGDTSGMPGMFRSRTPDMGSGGDGLFPDAGQSDGFRGVTDMRQGMGGRGMIDILRTRGVPFPDPRVPMDPRFRGMGPGMGPGMPGPGMGPGMPGPRMGQSMPGPGMPGPGRFPPPGMDPRGMAPPAILGRLRMLQRMRGF